MQEIKVKGTINAPAKKVWEKVSDFGNLHTFVDAIASCTTEETENGIIRTLTLQDGGEVTERLENLDNERRILNYSIVDSPMPIRNYSGSMQVKEAGDNQSDFLWSSTFEVSEGSENEIKEALEGLYSLGVEGLRKNFA
jgi:hypothetical protein